MESEWKVEASIATSADIISFEQEGDDTRRPSTSESLMLIKAFMEVSDPVERRRIIKDVERIAEMCLARRS